MKLAVIAAAAVLGAAIAGCASTTPMPGHTMPEAAAAAPSAPQLHAAMRGLWQGHIATTRDYALAAHAGNAGAAQKAEAAVVGNARQIAGAVSGFYGPAAGDGLFKLLAGHWGGVKALTNAAKAGDAAGGDQAMAALAANGTEIARFLAGANPRNWTVDALQGALLMHAGDHRQQIDAMMANAPVAQQQQLWTDMQHHMGMIADVLSDGIAKQFPDKAN